MRPGDTYDCEICGQSHSVKEDENSLVRALGFREYYVDCPEYGYVPV